jgi:hypothetical protein
MVGTTYKNSKTTENNSQNNLKDRIYSVNKMLIKLRVLWLGGRCKVTMYSNNDKILGMSDFSDEQHMTSYFILHGIKAINIKTSYREYTIKLNKFKGFRLVNNTDGTKILHIENMDGTETEVKI